MRSSAFVRLGAILVAAAAGCYADLGDDGSDTTSTSVTAHAIPPAPLPHISVTGANGRAVIDNLFEQRDQIYAVAFLGSRGSTPVGSPVAGIAEPATQASATPLAHTIPLSNDYTFAVFDAEGHLLSADDTRCRRLRIDASGAIDKIYGARDHLGHACRHGFTRDLAPHGSGGLALQLAPFEMSRTHDRAGNQTYVVKLIRAESTDFEKTRLSASFSVAASAPAATCGNGVVESGETCDDGNTMSGDGCSSTCQGEPCCGDGVVETGEQCDDGNNVDGDGCSSSCTVETPTGG